MKRIRVSCNGLAGCRVQKGIRTNDGRGFAIRSSPGRLPLSVINGQVQQAHNYSHLPAVCLPAWLSFIKRNADGLPRLFYPPPLSLSLLFWFAYCEVTYYFRQTIVDCILNSVRSYFLLFQIATLHCCWVFTLFARWIHHVQILFLFQKLIIKLGPCYSPSHVHSWSCPFI